ncbi:uncharacterized protein LOC134189821 isoform X2 [Corticium candelabrum]|uniref:uncharacterized protein LOC134189821 isoform X2 n=1 Tax=Corticium candelabrum TaxID=121492 RepID=UPI002E276BDF|nr:uncharacterized protein LOC134189821 isoform X2 [Corticium candelabrum]
MDNIQVAVRVRPLNERERREKASVHWNIDGNTVRESSGCSTVYTFDRIFSMDSTNELLFKEFASPIVSSVVEGFHGTIFAYGQTASGKTYTMMGEADTAGVIPLALRELFGAISRSPTREFLMRVSYIEIYNEVITDLLQPSKTHLKIKETAQKEVFVDDCSEECLSNYDMALDLIRKGEKNRHFGDTSMNERSSRSHTVFSVVVESREKGGETEDKVVKVAKLNLVDLAGSERVHQTGAEGNRLKEGGYINRSLFHLANVIQSLSDRESGYIPFRDSKLTRILQTSLGGNARTRVICTITPVSLEETHSTLRFAIRAKTIKNNAHVNEVLSDGALLKRYQTQIKELNKQLDETGIGKLKSENERLALENQHLSQEKSQEQAQLEQKVHQLESFILSCGIERKSQNPKGRVTSKSKNAFRRQTLCPAMLMHRTADDSLDSTDEEDLERLKRDRASSLLSKKEIQDFVKEMSPDASSPLLEEGKMVQHTFTCSDKESSETALNEQLVADLHQEVKVLKAELDLKDSEVSETLAEWKEQAQKLYIGEMKKLESVIESQNEQLAVLQADKEQWMQAAEESQRQHECFEAERECEKQTVEETHKTELAEVERKLRKVQSDLEIERNEARSKLSQLQERLELELKTKDEQIDRLVVEAQETATDTKRVRSNYDDQIQQIRQLLKEKEDECKEMTEVVANMRAQMDQSMREREQIEKEMSEARASLESMRLQDNKKEIELSKRQAIGKDQLSDIEDLKRQLKDALSCCSRMEVERSEMSSKLELLNEQAGLDKKEKDKQIDYLKCQVQQRECEVKTAQDALGQQLNEALSLATVKRKSLEESISFLSEERSILETELQQAKNDLENVTEKLSVRQEEYDVICQQMAELELKNIDMRGELEEKEILIEKLEAMKVVGLRQYDSVKAQLEKVSLELQSVMNQAEITTQECQERENHILNDNQTLKEQLVDARKQTEELSACQERMKDELDELKLKRKQEQRFEAERECEKRTIEERHTTELVEVERKLREVQSDSEMEKNEARSKLSQLQEHFKLELKMKNEQIDRLVVEAQETAIDTKRARSNCDDQIQQTCQLLQKKEDECKEMAELVANMRSQMDQSMREREQIEREMSEAKASLESMTLRNNKKVVESQRHEQVKAQLEKTKLELESLNSQVTVNKQEWQKRQTHLLNQNESLMQQLADARKKIEERSTNQTEAEVSLQNEKVKKLEEENTKLQNKTQRLLKDRERINRVCVTMDDELEEFKLQEEEKRNQLETKLSKATEELHEKMKDNRALKEQLKAYERSNRGKGEREKLVAGDWQSNASEAAAYALRLQRDKLTIELEEEKKKCEKSERKLLRTEHELKKLMKRERELEEERLTLKRQLNSKDGRGSGSTTRECSAKRAGAGFVSSLSPLSAKNEDIRKGDKNENDKECVLSGQELLAKSNSKPDAVDKCQTQ